MLINSLIVKKQNIKLVKLLHVCINKKTGNLNTGCNNLRS